MGLDHLSVGDAAVVKDYPAIDTTTTGNIIAGTKR